MSNGKESVISDIKSILSEIKKSKKMPSLPTRQPVVFTAKEAREQGLEIDMPEDWMIKIMPPANGEEPVTTFISPAREEVSWEDIFVTPEGRWTTMKEQELFEAQLEEQYTVAEQEYQAKQADITEMFRKLYPVRYAGLPEGQEVSYTEDIVQTFAHPDLFEAFLQDVYESGRTAETEQLLRTLMPEITEQDLNEFFSRPVEGEMLTTELTKWEMAQPRTTEYPEMIELAGDQLAQAWNEKTGQIRISIEDYDDYEDWLDAIHEADKVQDERAKKIFMSAIGVGGAWLEKYIGRPWELAFLEAEHISDMGMPDKMPSRITGAEAQAHQIMERAYEKYGWTAIFSPEVTEAWETWKTGSPKAMRGLMTAYEWLNPAYTVPIGGVFGQAAKFTSKIPVIGRMTRYIAGTVNAIEKGITYPLAKPLEVGVKYTAKELERLGVKIGDAAVNRLIKQNEILENIMDLPANKEILEGVIVDNWIKKGLTIGSKIPGIRGGIEKSLGWRILIKKESQAIEDIMGRAAVIHAEVSRRGVNAKAPEVWALRNIERNPIKLFGFDDTAFSSKMANRLLPDYAAEKDIAGTLEHVFTSPEAYSWQGMDRGLEYVTKVHDINTRMTNLLVNEGVPPKTLTEDWWIHRVVTGKFNPEEELIALRGRPGVKGGRIGAKPSYEMHRKAPTMAEGIAWGIKYNQNPETAVSSYIQEAFKKIADSRFTKYVEGFGVLPSERLAQRFPELIERVTLAKDELADAAKFHSVINRAMRGERLPKQTLNAIERRFPELGKKFRALAEEPAIAEKQLRDLLSQTEKTMKDLQNRLKKAEAIDIQKIKSEAAAEALKRGIPDEQKMTEAFRLMEFEDRLAFREAMNTRLTEIVEISTEQTAELTAMKEVIDASTLKKLIPVWKRIMNRKDQVKDLTLKEFREITGRQTPIHIKTDRFKRQWVSWDETMDQVVSQYGFATPEELWNALDDIGRLSLRQSDFRVMVGLADSRGRQIEKMLKIMDNVDASPESIAKEVIEPGPQAVYPRETGAVRRSFSDISVPSDLTSEANTLVSSQAKGSLDRASAKFLPSDTLKILSESTKYRNVDDFFTIASELYQKAPENAKALMEIINDLGIHNASLSVKSIESLADKVARKSRPGKMIDVTEINDLIRGTVVVENEAKAREILSSLGNRVKKSDDFFKSPKNGYRGINADVILPDGSIAELQIHTVESLEAAESMHLWYDSIWKKIERMPGAEIADMSMDEFTKTLERVIEDTRQELKATKEWLTKQRAEIGYEKASKKLIEEEAARVKALEDRLPTFEAMIKSPEEYYPRLKNEFPNIHDLILDRGRELKIISKKQPIPKAEPGMPEAGMQPDIFGYQHPVYPKGKGQVTQMSMDEYGKLVDSWKKAGLPDDQLPIAMRPKVEGVKALEGEAQVAKVAYEPPKVKTPAERRAELEAIRKEVKALTEARKAPYWQTRHERAFRMEQMRQPEIGEGYLPQPFATGRIFKQDFIDSFNKFFGYDSGLGVLRVTSDVAGILRITKAALDFSAMAIQGLPSWGLAHAYMVQNPKIGVKMLGSWYRAFFESTRAFFDPNAFSGYMAKNEKIAMQRIAFGGSSHAVDFFQALEVRTGLGGKAEWLMEHIPLKPYHRAETSFYAAGEIVRDEFWRMLSPKAIARGQEFELARFLDRITGITDAAHLGVPVTTRQLEQTFVWFAPNYTRACLTVLADMFRGGMTGAEARKAIGGMIAAGSAMYTGIQFSLQKVEGKSDEEAWQTVQEGFGIRQDPITGEYEWRPSAEFMTIQVGNYRFGFGGFWYGLLRLAGNISSCVNEIGDKERVDLVKVMKNGQINRDNPFIYWWYSRSSPMVGVGFDLASGKDFLGYPIETPAEYGQYIATRFEPIWAEQGLNWMVPGLARENEIPEGLARSAVVPAELFGLRTFPESIWVDFYDEVNDYIKRIPEEELDEKQLEAWRNGELEWQQLTEIQKTNLFSRYPELEELYGKAQADSELRASPNWEAWQKRMDEEREIYYTRIDELTRALLKGEIDTREYRDKAGEAGMNFGAILSSIERDPNYSDIYDYFNSKQPEGEYGFLDDIMLGEYQSDILYAEDLTDSKGDYDWTERDRRIEAFIEKWGQAGYDRIQKYLEEQKYLKGLNEVWIRKSSDTELLGREYWKLPYKPIFEMDEEDELEGNIPAEYKSIWKKYQALPEEEREAFLEKYPDLAKDWRAEWRLNNPEDDARLALWGYGGKLQSMEAYNLVVQWSQELGIPLEKMGLGLPPRNLVENYFDYNKLVKETSAGSSQAKLYRIENPQWEEWAEENWGWKPVDENPEVLRINVNYADQDKEYEAIFSDDQTEQRIAREKYLEENPDYAEARRTREALREKFPEDLVDNYVEYYDLPEKGYWRKRYLLENTDFYNAMLDIREIEKIDPERVPVQAYDEIYDKWQDLFEQYENAEGTARQKAEFRNDLFEHNLEFHKDWLRRSAYGKYFPEDQVENYVSYYMIMWEGKPEGYDRWYDDDWFLMENPEFYNTARSILEWKERDFSEVPTREVFSLYQVYRNLPAGKPRYDYRAKHLDLDAWLVKTFDLKPIQDRGDKEAEKTPWDEYAEAEAFKDLFR